MIGPLLWLIYLLILIPNAGCLVTDNGLVSTVWCKHRFQRLRYNFDRKFVRYYSLQQCKRVLSRRKLSDCLSVCQTRDLWQNKIKFCPNFYTIWKNVYPIVYRHEECWWKTKSQ